MFNQNGEVRILLLIIVSLKTLDVEINYLGYINYY